MQVQTITINGKTLTNAEALTLRMVLGMIAIELEEIDPKRKLDGLEVSEHLRNVRQLRLLVGEG